MATEINIDPVTRLEGHLGVSVSVEDGVVVEAKCSGTMLVGRDPRDAPVHSQRICGVCHQSHRITGVRALENATGTTVPDGARVMRNLIEAV